MKVLVFAPHPDDEVIGAGGTMAKHSLAGDEVDVCIVTKAYAPDWPKEHPKVARREALAAGKALGVKSTKFLDFPTVKLNTVSTKALCDSFSEAVKASRPDVVYLPFPGDTNKDHAIVFECGLVAARPYGEDAAKRVLAYETITSSIFPGFTGPTFSPNVFVDIEKTLQSKLRAMRQYRSQLLKWPNPRSIEGLTVLAKRRGMQVGLDAAEGFALVRETL